MSENYRRLVVVPVAIAYLCLLPLTATAASPEGQFAVKEAGTQPCSRFIAERDARTDLYFSFRGWVAGYISQYNKSTPDTTDILSWQTIDLVDLLLTNFCKANPETRYIAAVDNLVRALYPTRLRSISETVKVEGAERPIQLYKTVLRRIQQTLTERGHYGGAIDGAFGPATSAAIKAFQAEAGLPETGYPDQITLLRLFR